MSLDDHSTEFLVVHDYGMGGVWAVVSADNPAQIESRFNDVTLVKKRPDWMDADQYQQIKSACCMSIDDPVAAGWLAILERERA